MTGQEILVWLIWPAIVAGAAGGGGLWLSRWLPADPDKPAPTHSNRLPIRVHATKRSPRRFGKAA